MENKVELVKEVNGQKEIIWEELESVTSIDFVDRIKYQIESNEKLGKTSISLVSIEAELDIDVLYNFDGVLVLFTYNYTYGNYSVHVFGKTDLKRFVNALGGTIQWK